MQSRPSKHITALKNNIQKAIGNFPTVIVGSKKLLFEIPPNSTDPLNQIKPHKLQKLMSIEILKEPVPGYKLRKTTLGFIAKYLNIELDSEEQVTYEILQQIIDVGRENIPGMGKVSEIDILNKLLCMRGNTKLTLPPSQRLDIYRRLYNVLGKKTYHENPIPLKSLLIGLINQTAYTESVFDLCIEIGEQVIPGEVNVESYMDITWRAIQKVTGLIPPKREDFIITRSHPLECKKKLGVFYSERHGRSFVYDAQAYREAIKKFNMKTKTHKHGN